MFFLPIPIEGRSGEPVIQTRQSRGYEYSIMKYAHSVIEDEPAEPYTVLTNSDQTKIFAYMAPRETIGFDAM